MKVVIVASPFAGDIEFNVEYAKRCMLDSLKRGEAPFASHLLYPGILNDDVAEEREKGFEAGLAWIKVARALVVYTDHGISTGMQREIDEAEALGVRVEFRTLEP